MPGEYLPGGSGTYAELSKLRKGVETAFKKLKLKDTISMADISRAFDGMATNANFSLAADLLPILQKPVAAGGDLSSFADFRTSAGCNVRIYPAQLKDLEVKIRWSGACVEGYASGKGVLVVGVLAGEYYETRYEGTLDGGYLNGTTRVTETQVTNATKPPETSQVTLVRGCDVNEKECKNTASLKLLRSYGNGCAKLSVTVFKISGDWAEAEFALRNNCNSKQLIEVLLSYDVPPIIRPPLTDVVGQTSRPLWPEAELAYPNLPFQPTNQLSSAIALTANGGAVIKMRQIAPGSEYQYKIASCDAFTNGKENVVFRDLSLDAGFVCVPYPR